MNNLEEELGFFKDMALIKLEIGELTPDSLERIINQIIELADSIGRKRGKEMEGKTIPVKNLNYEDTPNDPIKPNHYHRNEIDVHGYLQKHFPKQGGYTVAEGFHIGNVIKYVSRYKNKNGLEDLKKAEANLKILIELEESK